MTIILTIEQAAKVKAGLRKAWGDTETNREVDYFASLIAILDAAKTVELVGGTLTVAGIQHCTIIKVLPDTDLYAEITK